jgi:hypothetical protein
VLAYAKGPTFDPVTMDEVADRLRVDPMMVQVLFHYDSQFPEPCWIVDGFPFWEWCLVEKWARKMVLG